MSQYCKYCVVETSRNDKKNDFLEEGICPACGGGVEHWNQGIYECKDYRAMFDGDEE